MEKDEKKLEALCAMLIERQANLQARQEVTLRVFAEVLAQLTQSDGKALAAEFREEIQKSEQQLCAEMLKQLEELQQRHGRG